MTKPALVSAFVFLVASATLAQDVVILRDGYTIKGRVYKEKEPVFEGGPLKFTRVENLDVVDCGPRALFFSAHNKKGAVIEKNLDHDLMTKLTRPLPGSFGRPLPAFGEILPTEWDNYWHRKLMNKVPGQMTEPIDQYITYMDPKTIYLVSSSHRWRSAAYLDDFGPAAIRKLLSTYPDLRDPVFGFIDPERRIRIARFLKDAGWFQFARRELDQLKKDAPWAWPKKADELYDIVLAEIEDAQTDFVIREVELSMNSGRYKLSQRALEEFKPKSPNAKALEKLGVLKAQIQTVQPFYEDAVRLLKETADSLNWSPAAKPWGASLGAFAMFGFPDNKLTEEQAILVEAARAIVKEVHPDSASRLKKFMTLANQRNPPEAEKLLALAVTGWVNGEGGAFNEPAVAIRAWKTREMLLEYLRDPIAASRARILKVYEASSNKLSPDEVARIVALLPPLNAEDLKKIRGEIVPEKDCGYKDVYKITIPKSPEYPDAQQYILRLPPEYHHGRSYPVIVGLNHSTLPAEKMIAMLAQETDRRGYILAVPVWGSSFGDANYDLSGKEHPKFTRVVRDLSNRFQIDVDRVSTIGFGAGANFALDLAMSKPDMLASCVAMGAVPDEPFYRDYWRNAQKVPIYAVTGELSGLSVANLRTMYERWLPLGYPMLLSVYKGRGVEWYGSELSYIFDWIDLKKRVRGTASLRLDSYRFDAWQTMRDTDNRFYWISGSDIKAGFKMTPPNKAKPVIASFRGDIRQGKDGNEITIDEVKGVKKITIWLERDMIVWNAPIKVTVLNTAVGFRAKLIEQNLSIMLEELYNTGDRKMLFFGKIELGIPG